MELSVYVYVSVNLKLDFFSIFEYRVFYLKEG